MGVENYNRTTSHATSPISESAALKKHCHQARHLDQSRAVPITNEVYGYEVVDLHAWEKAEGETNAFAAPGRSGAMVIPQDVLELRAARVKTQKRSARDK